MSAFIEVGSTTTHGGVVQEGESFFLLDGKPIHLEGMQHYCPQCKTMAYAIASSAHMVINGKSAIVENDFTSCGARFITTQRLMVRDGGVKTQIIPSNAFTSQNHHAESFSAGKQEDPRFGQQFVLEDDLTHEPLCNVNYEVYQHGKLITRGKTDQNGLTQFIEGQENEEIELRVVLGENCGVNCCKP